MQRLLDLDNWYRKEHFLFFKQMEEPFFGITTKINCSIAYQKSKELGISFFAYYLHKIITAVNQIECFRYRIVEDQIYIYETIDVSPTILRADHTFGFSKIAYCKDLKNFAIHTSNEIARVQTTTGLFTTEFSTPNVIHFSALPWIDFTSFSHARGFSFPDSCPKISVGKMTDFHEIKSLPISIHVHHGLVDGYHVGQYIELLQNLLDS